MVICDYYGIVWQKSNIGFWVNFQFQNYHPRYKITVSSPLKWMRQNQSESIFKETVLLWMTKMQFGIPCVTGKGIVSSNPYTVYVRSNSYLIWMCCHVALTFLCIKCCWRSHNTTGVTQLTTFYNLLFVLQVIPDSNTTLVLSLHHPQAHVREMAVKRLGDLLTEKEVELIKQCLTSQPCNIMVWHHVMEIEIKDGILTKILLHGGGMDIFQSSTLLN